MYLTLYPMQENDYASVISCCAKPILNDKNPYVIIIALSAPKFKAGKLQRPKIQKGDILFSTQRFARGLCARLSKTDQATLIIANLTPNNIKLIEQLHEFDEFIHVSPAVKASYPILNDTLDIINNHYAKDLKIVSSILERLFVILQSEALNALRLSQRPETILSDVIEEQKIAKAISLIHSDLTEDWSVARLASEVKMAAPNFLKHFKKIVTINPDSYILKWRLQHAISLLDQNKLRLPKIAQISGFKSEAEFCQKFTENFGFSPDQYRHRNIH